MENLQTLSFDEKQVRTIDRDGELWWVLKDVCYILELSDTNKVSERLDEDELTRIKLVSGGQEREMLLISESGLYNVILRSDKPKAKPFRKWVTHEVLPSIRKTGSYSVAEKEKSPLSGQMAILEAQNSENRERILAIENEYDKINLIMAQERAERLAKAYYKTKRGCFEESLEPELKARLDEVIKDWCSI
jgi:prophage antirepressor-like protein